MAFTMFTFPFARHLESELSYGFATLHRHSQYVLLRKTREFESRPRPPRKTTPFGVVLRGGEGEIRTRGELPHDGFQDRYLKPLGHLSIGVH